MHCQNHFPLFLLTILTISCIKSSAQRCNIDDETGLLSFKSGIRADPSGILTSWKKGTDCCKWNGVECQSDNNRVRSLYLSGQSNNLTSSLSGTISESLSKLIHLDSIYLMDLKNLQGPFPSFLLGLKNLMYVYIENNKLSGSIPENISKLGLVALSLEGNKFSGPIPSSIGDLANLTDLRLGNNLLTGTIPGSIQKLKKLYQIRLEHNQLTGPVPDFFSGLSALGLLRLSYNKFTGNIPKSISVLASRLMYLELGHNSLTGQIPDFLGSFHALDTLDLSSNRFSGIVPKSFANLTKIFNLDLSHNMLVDPFPKMYVKGIESLDLSYNSFNLGTIPQWVSNSPIIYSLKLAKCGIKLKLEDWTPSETYFYDYIDLSENEITGSPVKLLNSTEYLLGFYASGNKLKFNFESLVIKKNMTELDLSRNLVFGKVPKLVIRLQKLNVSGNHLCGQLPVTKFQASAFSGNDCLCGSPLPKCKSKSKL